MSKYKGLFTFDVDNHRYVTVGVADGIIDCMDYEPSEPAEPLIKDEKIREAVRAWAEANGVKDAEFEYVEGVGSTISHGAFSARIVFYEDLRLTNRKRYTIAELCGEEEE